MLLFRSEEHVDRWCADRGLLRGGILTLVQLWELATAWYANRIAPDWRRGTAEEAEAVFAEIGLTGPFWRLTVG
ncbi:MAG: hypothetical protein ACRDHO_11390 [Actinomycetota bacterium]